ncbi:DoxX family protein [Sinorhizobium meliloti]|uniref:DoxX family protein n=1 Tax=Rhizobium meliloti TaxID=382 RepID=UPI000FD487D4|nr:DoxX family protein [Sinorhizobium meliloti]RVG78858.1 DoxX family protein [Sinorhizobium meliloti]RVI34728.1 DoxX family protein [Sinorhizobium meliloti]RVI45611.1 DoxX family protein [Sinorhizobium meliloti]RVJ19848.1 DoxX family protein [Sinorhizobium meliloti]RVJ66927.1 DoxX family protein [Sinorhizobium meliloti]
MTTISKETGGAAYARPLITSPPVRFLALLALCSAYIQGPLMKIYDFEGAIAEMNHFGLTPAPLFAVGVIVFELAMSALILLGIFRWAAALCLAVFTVAATFLAFRFWELPSGMERMMATNGFFEHLGLAGAFVLVAWHDLHERTVSGKVRAL